MTGVIDSKGNFHNLYFYKIQELCEVMTNTAISDSEELKMKYKNEYKNKITRFSSEFEFCLHELGWMVYDPFCQDRDEVMFSNGERDYVASIAYVRQEGFDRKKVKNDKVGFPLLTDEYIGFDSKLENLDNLNGIVDERGYVRSTFLPRLEDLATLELMFDMIKDEELYNDYIKRRPEFSSDLEYLTNKKNVISIHQKEDGKYSLEFATENDGKVQYFIEALKNSGKLTELTPLVQEEDAVKKVA